MHDRAAALGPVHQSDVFLNAVIGFNFKAPPIRPERTTDTSFCQFLGNFVRFHTVVKGAHPVTKLFGHIKYGEHFVGAITMHVHQNIAA